MSGSAITLVISSLGLDAELFPGGTVSDVVVIGMRDVCVKASLDGYVEIWNRGGILTERR